VDWCVDTRVEGAGDAVVADLVAHLRRHAEFPDVVDLAEPMVREAIVPDAGAPLRWLSIDWEHGTARLSVADLVAGAPWPAATSAGRSRFAVGPGATRADEATAELWQHVASGPITMDLPIVRAPERDLDPIPIRLSALPASRDSFLIETIALMAAPETDLTHPEEKAAVAGASLGDALAGNLDGTRNSLADVASAIVAFERTIGGDFYVADVDERTAVLANRRCPFGDTVRGAPSLCRLTSALAGRAAANAVGPVAVSIPERLASGDHQCRVVIDLTERKADPTSHHYGTPPAGLVAPVHLLPQRFTRGLQVALSLRLPRDELSVPFVRRLTRHALAEVGVVDDDRHAVELVLTEAAANVLEHAGPGDLYDVNVEINPTACEIRVIDVGRGFDHERLGGEMADTSAEAGRGIALMHTLMDQVLFTSHPERGTIVHLVKHLQFDDDAPARALMLRELRDKDG
jgi:serine/threonine-protein kinase RsbW